MTFRKTDNELVRPFEINDAVEVFDAISGARYRGWIERLGGLVLVRLTSDKHHNVATGTLIVPYEAVHRIDKHGDLIAPR